MAREGDDLAVISPEPISQQNIVEFVTNPSAGGIAVFIGTTRDNFKGKKVVRLEYEAYTSMAMKQLQKLCLDVRSKWPVCKMAIVHRTGVVPVGEASVMIAVSAEHRKEALEAVSYAIDQVKSTAAIWKKEVYEDEAEQWKENKECLWLQANLS
jgi:molybdopterin synthase catalytic subunit